MESILVHSPVFETKLSGVIEIYQNLDDDIVADYSSHLSIINIEVLTIATALYLFSKYHYLVICTAFEWTL